MAAKLPYMASPGLIPKILGKIQEARRPDRFTQDFLETKLGYSGGSSRPIIPLLKRMGFLSSDGSPTSLYDRFRNATTQGGAIAQDIKNAFSELFERNEYAHDLPKEKLTGLIAEITGAEKDSRSTQLTVSTFNALKEFADFEAEVPSQADGDEQRTARTLKPATPPVDGAARLPTHESREKVGFNVSYTINLNLPETTNPDVFNAIFRSLRENLLRNE